MRGETVLDVDERDRVLLEDERVLARQVAEQEDVGVDALLLEPEDQGGGGADRVAVGAHVGGDEDAFGAGERFDDLLVAVVHAEDDTPLRWRERSPAPRRTSGAVRWSRCRARSAA